MESCRTGTKFATARDESSIYPIVAEVIEFLTHLYDSRSSCSVINTATHALSAAIDLSDSLYKVGERTLIKKFINLLKRLFSPDLLFEDRTIWDVSKPLGLLKVSISPAGFL